MRNFRGSHSAGAAVNFGNAVGVFAYEFTFGFGAVGFVAFPVTFGFLADGLAFWFGSLAVSNAVRLFADSDAFRAVEHFASFIGAFNFTFGFLTFDIADGVLGFSTRSVTFRRFADRVANCRAVRIIALPGALRVALNN